MLRATAILLAGVAVASAVLFPLHKTWQETFADNGDSYPSPPFQWYTEQLVDHFDHSNDATWNQRYTVNDTFWQPGGPVFFFLAGEAPMQFFEFQEVQAINWAAEFGAMYVVLEHRFYGESLPYPDYSTESLTVLSSEQALADAAQFLEWFNAGLAQPGVPNGPWVVFGCSYAAGLAAWFRAKYPNLVIGAVAPSGPVQATLDYWQYNAWFQDVAPPECAAATKNATDTIMQLLQTPEGMASLSQTFNACVPLLQEDVFYFLYSLVSDLASADQFNNPPQWPLTAACDIMTQPGSTVANWAQVLNTNLGPAAAAMPQAECTDFRQSTFIEQMQNTSSQQRSWLYQTCTEFGYFGSSYANSTVFFPDVDVRQIVEWCGEIFGIPNMTPNIAGTNAYYGGYNLEATNVVFTNGQFDPWHILSITEPTFPGVHAVMYEAGHCGTLIAATDEDPESLTQAREQVRGYLAKWLQEAKESKTQ